MARKLENKVAVITGGNSGIGLSTAKLFQAGGDSVGFTSDASKLDDIVALYDNIKERFGKIDVLFLNAGIAKFGPFTSVDEATFDAMLNINLKGLFFNVQKALPLLNEGASVIFTTSIADQKGFPDTSVYSATKAAVRSLERRFLRSW